MTDNLFSSLDPADDREQFETLVETSAFTLEHILSTGQITPPGEWYDQDRDEWVALLSGSATLRFEQPDELVHLAPGDWLLITAHRRHRVEATAANSATVWIALHFDR